MNAQERAEALVTARFLHVAERSDLMATCIVVVAVMALVLRRAEPIMAVVAIVSGIAARYFGARIAVDRRLFADLGEARLTPAELDGALASMRLQSVEEAGRSIAERSRGARRLVFGHAAAVMLEVTAMVAAVLVASR